MCKKHMWDAASFENHVKGRTHMMMKDGVEESYRLRANMIRQEAKIEEQLKTIELERLKRMGKGSKGNPRREYCTMCDLHFFGNLSSHRKTDGHLQLKKFLHPRCGECAQEFSNRIDYDTHLLMPEHMKKAFVTRANKPERRKNALVVYTAEDELKDLKEEKEVRKKAAAAKKVAAAAAAAAAGAGEGGDEKEGGTKVEGGASAAAATNADGTPADEPMDEEDDDDDDDEKAAVDGDGGDAPNKSSEGAGGDDDETGADANAEDADKTTASGAADASMAEAEDVILDYSDGDDVPCEVEGKIPKYNCHRQIGFSMLHKLDCFECHLCGRFFDTERTAEIHSRTMTHHRNFVKFLNDKSNDTKIAEKRAAAAQEENDRKRRKLEAAAAVAAAVVPAAATTPAASADSQQVTVKTEPNAVTVKVEPTDAAAAESATSSAEPKAKSAGEETYDPSEATADDDLDDTKADHDDDDDAMDADSAAAEVNAAIKEETLSQTADPVDMDTQPGEPLAATASTPTSVIVQTPRPESTDGIATATTSSPAAPPAVATTTTTTQATPAATTPTRSTPQRRGRGRGARGGR